MTHNIIVKKMCGFENPSERGRKMILSEKEITVIKDLQTQEQCCVEKYERYSKLAKDQVLIDLFTDLHGKEKKHLESLTQVLSGKVPSCDCNDSDGKDYNPAATYSMAPSEDKKTDCFLATDCIGTEKLVSSTYNTEVFAFGDPGVRKLLADIQIEEQNHAEMLYKYKTVNSMA